MSDEIDFDMEDAEELSGRLKRLAVRLQKAGLLKEGDNTKVSKVFQRAMSLWHEETGKALREFQNYGSHMADEDEIDSRVVLRLKEEMGRSPFS
ncbi:MAG: hypothetical protein JW993_02180 [Sedimentisphaerales bacterium]|nr:hypothetical protein [Sedimentisphaerales bacterium]